MPAAANLVPDDVRAHHLPLGVPGSIVGGAGDGDGGGFEEILRVRVEQRHDSGAQFWFVGAHPIQILAPFFRVALESARVDLTNQPRFFIRGGHGG